MGEKQDKPQTADNRVQTTSNGRLAGTGNNGEQPAIDRVLAIIGRLHLQRENLAGQLANIDQQLNNYKLELFSLEQQSRKNVIETEAMTPNGREEDSSLSSPTRIPNFRSTRQTDS